eukprot:1195295-Prorocentrum_minimum.AAC.1
MRLTSLRQAVRRLLERIQSALIYPRVGACLCRGTPQIVLMHNIGAGAFAVVAGLGGLSFCCYRAGAARGASRSRSSRRGQRFPTV